LKQVLQQSLQLELALKLRLFEKQTSQGLLLELTLQNLLLEFV
jgi:hypothetical protein